MCGDKNKKTKEAATSLRGANLISVLQFVLEAIYLKLGLF